MKQFFTSIIALLCTVTVFAQTPQLLNYQAVLRNSSGQVSMNESVNVDFIIHSGSASGPEVYAEAHSATTNEYGLVNLKVGDGTPSAGNFANIDWASNSYFLEVEIDGASAGTQEMVSVPYSLYAAKAGSAANDNDTSPTNEIQSLSINGNQLSLTDGGTVTLPGGGGGSEWAANGTNIYSANSGNVGIGIDSPVDKLYVNSAFSNRVTMNSDEDFYAGFRSIIPSAEFFAGVQPGRYSIFNNTSQTEGISVLNNGNVGVNNIGPAGRFHVSEGTNFTPVITGEYTTAGVNNDNPAVLGRNNLDDYYGFGVKGEAGYIGVFGEVNGTAGNDYIGVYGTSNGGTGTNYGVYGAASGGTTNYAGYFVGDLAYTGTLSQVSDARLKTNVNSLDGALDKLLQLSPKTYNYKTERYSHLNLADGLQMGFIAQEVQAIFPELAHENVYQSIDKTDDTRIEYISVDYISLIPVLTGAIQEQQEIIDAQNAKIEAIEAALAKAGISLD